jgi:hypothetical protein
MLLPNEVEMPPRVAARPRDKRGYPILFTSAVIDGVPDFRISSLDAVLRAAEESLCGVCGQRLDYWLVFIGGPVAVANRAFGDPPMHRACAEYALAVCPYLATKADRSQALQAKHGELLRKYDPTMIREKPSRLALYTTRGFRVYPNGKGIIFRAEPAKQIDWKELGHA